MLKRLSTSLGLLYLYFAHVAMLRLMGPKCAILFTRVTAFAHWLLTFIGFDKRVRRAMEQVLPEIRPDLGVGSVLYKHVVVRHQHFVQWKIFPTVRGRRFAEHVCRKIEGKEHLDAALQEGRGVILAGFHIGMGRMNSVALMSHGYRTYQHQLSAERFAQRSYDWVARAVIQSEIQVEEAAGQEVIHHRPGSTHKVLADLLRRNSIVVLVVDGMAASRFVELPFLNGMMSFSTGPARLAAETGAAIVCTFAVLEGLTRHRFILSPPLYCQDSSPASMEATVRSYVSIFEEYVRRYPWTWWSWRRLDVEGGKGQTRYVLKEAPTEETRYYSRGKEDRRDDPGQVDGPHTERGSPPGTSVEKQKTKKHSSCLGFSTRINYPWPSRQPEAK